MTKVSLDDDFLDRLATDAGPVVRTGGTPFAVSLAVGASASAAVIVLLAGLRSDLAAAAVTPIFLWKLLSMTAIAASSLLLLHRAGRPGAIIGGLAKLPLIVAGVLLLGLLAVVAVIAPDKATDIRLAYAPSCIAITSLATIPVWLASLHWLRAAAPTNLARASWAAGTASTAIAATLFVLHCPHDSVAYVVLWYGGTIAMIAGLTRLVLPHLIRW